ncbi:uncharacterized protein [Rutidosis leptorrhynchoides]|uniref:uncharacterized protein n=1 Tax=Rutidosis leptorrhynchoides TaxID=125765 RepID=UPI003A9A0F66
MNIEIIGRHALLFDDDTNAAFINSDDALVEWNSLLIDRYDVRHLLSSPPPSRRRRNPQTTHSSSADAEIDYERYLDLPSPSDEQEHAKPEPLGGFNAVPFSYGNYEDFNDKKIAEAESEISGFQPPFTVPDSLVQNLPPTEKVHQIIARTALFVSKNGGQSEIVLRVKQGDNPTFGFLMPDHHLHPYFRFLVDNQHLLQSDNEKTSTTENPSGAGALSLLGSVYGNVEDDDGGVEPVSLSVDVDPTKSHASSVDVDPTKSHAPGKTILPAVKDEPVSKLSVPSKEDAPVQKRSPSLNSLKAERTSSMKKDESLDSLSVVPDKLRASSLPPIPKTEQMVLDPPYDMKRLVDKIVEFIIKNGRQFEAVLMEQDRGHGRFPFLLPSNIFHPYYLKVLQQAQEPKLTVRGLHNEKDDFGGHIPNKKRSISRENENRKVESDDVPFDSERKEKFKMVINKSKKEGSEPAKATQPQLEVQVDAAQAAAILQAATRGIKLPNLGILTGQPSNEAESSETQMTREQKIKAERLKRAKMFVAQLKSGAAPSKAEPSRGLSVEPQGSGANYRLAAKENERSTTPSTYDSTDKKVKSENEHLNEERRSKRNYRARAETAETLEDDEEDEREGKRSHRHHTKKHRSRSRSVEVESEEKDDEERDNKRVKRRRRSHRTSHKHDDIGKSNEERRHKSSRKKKHRSPSSYEEDDYGRNHEYSKRRHRSRHSSHEESDDGVDSDHKHSRKKHKHRSHRTSHHSRDKHRKSHSSKHRHKLDDSSEEGHRDLKKDDKHKKGLNSDREELEEGEISLKLSGQSVDGASQKHLMDVSSSHQGQRSPSQPIETTEVPDDLRAKIRAMLMSTM